MTELSEKTKNEIYRMNDKLALKDAKFSYWTALTSGFVQTFAPLLVPFTPAAFVGFEVYGLTTGTMPKEMALLVGFLSAFGMEAVGYVASHTTLRIYEYSQRTKSEYRKVKAGVGLVTFYMIAAISIILFSDINTYISVGVGMVVLTTITYISQGLTKWVRWAEEREEATIAKAQKAEAKQDQIAEVERERQYELELKRLELEAQKEIEMAKAKQNALVEKAKLKLEFPAEKAEKLNNSSGISERDLEILKQLKAQLGIDAFTSSQAQEITELGKTTIYEVLKRGIDADVVYKSGRGKYTINGIEKAAQNGDIK